MGDTGSPTPGDVLDKRLMSSCVSKTEREWYAKRKIERLKERNKNLVTENKLLRSSINIHQREIEALKEAIRASVEAMECEAIQNEKEWRTGMFCGLEDIGVTDRYDACIYGYNHAIERVNEWVIDILTVPER